MLREFIRECLLIEAANANFNGLGLLVHKAGNIKIVLYDAIGAINYIKNTRGFEPTPDLIKGVIEITKSKAGPCHGAWEVNMSAGVEGYGPTMYDIAMSLAGTIMPDRASVSQDAYSVWDYYNKRRQDVESLPFDTSKSRKEELGSKPLFYIGGEEDLPSNDGTPEKNDDCQPTKGPDFLNYAYRLKGGSIDVSRPMDLHLKIKEKLGKNAHQLDSMILGATTQFFSVQMAS